AVAEGAYRIVVVADADSPGAVFERGAESSNLLASSATLNVTHPDLLPAITLAPVSATSGDTIPFQWRVTNSGSAIANGTWVDRVYLSADQTFDASDVLLGELSHDGPLNLGGFYNASLNLTLPEDRSGAQFLLLRTD